MGPAQTRLGTGRLPVEATSFVDRRLEVAEVKRLLAAARLVTLTGVGGVGKTRLALRVARELRRAFTDGVRWIELIQVTDGSLLDSTIAAGIGPADQGVREPLAALAERVRDRALLLVLDNCEHLLDGCAGTVGTILRESAGLRVLCTSRQPLGIVGEHVWTVPSMQGPEPDEPLGAAADARYPALALFLERAVAASPGFAVTADNERAVVEICRRLDGLPLAIELAAARLRTLSPDQLAAGLRDRLNLLATRHAVPARHRTMESAFSWSYTLCTPAERDLWASVSVFADSFDLAAAERVCAGDHLLGALSGLVDKSVLVLDRATMRYRLLEPVRQFGCGRLRAAGRDRVLALRSAHRDWYLALAERFAAEWFGPCELEWIERVRVELPNLRAAIEFCLTTPGQEPAGQRLAGALSSFWRPGGALPEGRYWLERALAASRTPRRERLCALDAYGRIQRAQGRLPAAILTARECALTAKLLADRLYEARAVRDLGLTLLLEGDAVRAGPLLDTAARSLARHGESVDGLVMADLGRAMVALSKGDQARATELCAECRRLCLAHGDRWWLEQALTTSAHIAEVGGDSAQARAYVQEGLRSSRTFGDTVTAATAIEWLGWQAGRCGDAGRAARLLGAAHGLWRTGGPLLYGSAPWSGEHDRCVAAARRGLGDRGYEAAFRQGAELSIDDAVRYALGDDAPAVPHAAPARRGHRKAGVGLTPRELQVAELVAQGLSNKDIATRLVNSRRTVESHVENILRKLGFTSRTQVAGWVATNRPPTGGQP